MASEIYFNFHILNAFLHPFVAFLEHFYTRDTIPSQGILLIKVLRFPYFYILGDYIPMDLWYFSPIRNTLSTHQDKKLKKKKHNHLCLTLCTDHSSSVELPLTFLILILSCSQFPLNIALLPKHFLVHNFLPPSPVSPLINISVIQMQAIFLPHSLHFLTHLIKSHPDSQLPTSSKCRYSTGLWKPHIL